MSENELEKMINKLWEQAVSIYLPQINSTYELSKYEELDKQVVGEDFPEFYNLIVDTYNKIEEEKKQNPSDS